MLKLLFKIIKFLSKFCALISLLIVEISAQDFFITKIEQPITENRYIEYFDYTTAILCMQPDLMISDLEAEQLKLAQSLINIRDNGFEFALDDLNNLLQLDSSKIRNIAQDYLEHYYFLSANDYSKASQIKNNLVDDKYEETINPISIVKKSKDSLRISNQNGLIFIPIEINGKLYNFLLDTGTDISLISSKIHNFIKSPIILEQAFIETVAKKDVGAQFTEIESLKIGNNLVEYSDFLIIDDKNMQLNPGGFLGGLFSSKIKFDGVIGWNILQHFNMILDISSGYMILNPDYSSQTPRNMFWLGQPYITFKNKQGFDFYFFFDSGSQNSKITNVFLSKVELEKTGEEKLKISSFGETNKYTASIYSGLELYINNYKLNFNKILSNIEDNIRFSYYDGVLGSDVLGKLKVYISPEKGIFEILDSY